jgi:hypothetical protein
MSDTSWEEDEVLPCLRFRLQEDVWQNIVHISKNDYHITQQLIYLSKVVSIRICFSDTCIKSFMFLLSFNNPW